MDIGLLETQLTRQDINAFFLLIQPAHLQKLCGKPLNAAERDYQRAELIRQRLKTVSL